MYDIVCDREISKDIRSIGPQQKLALQKAFFVLKQNFHIPQNDIKNLIYFMYTHNPCKVEDLAEYGCVGMLQQVAPLYRRWYKGNGELILRMGLRKAITKTIPVASDVDDYLAGLLEGYVESVAA